MNHFGPDYLAARFSVWDVGLSRLGLSRPITGYRAWQESRRALRDSLRLDAHMRADIGLIPDGIHPPVADFVPRPTQTTGMTAANDNLAVEAA